MPHATLPLSLAAMLGALAAMPTPARAAQPIEQVWASASPVQSYGIAPPGQAPTQGAAVQLLNDASSGGDVYFLLDGQEQTLKSGQSLDLSADRSHLVEFNTGGDRGDLRFTLYQGLYKFKAQPDGWVLVKSSSAPSVASPPPAAGSRTQVQRGYFAPPMPAEDLRTRRVARRAEETTPPQAAIPAPQAKSVPQPPTAGIGVEQATAPSLPTPPPAGVKRDRTNAPRTP